jgi:hypothetical protein
MRNESLSALKELRELEDQMKLHGIFKEQRMNAMGWDWNENIANIESNNLIVNKNGNKDISFSNKPSNIKIPSRNISFNLNEQSGRFSDVKNESKNKSFFDNSTSSIDDEYAEDCEEVDEVELSKEVAGSFTDALGNHVISLSTAGLGFLLYFFEFLFFIYFA